MWGGVGVEGCHGLDAPRFCTSSTHLCLNSYADLLEGPPRDSSGALQHCPGLRPRQLCGVYQHCHGRGNVSVEGCSRVTPLGLPSSSDLLLQPPWASHQHPSWLNPLWNLAAQ